MIEIFVGNVRCKMLHLQDAAVKKKIENECSYMLQGHEFMPSHNGWDGRIRLCDSKGVFPIGLLPRITQILDEKNLEFKIIDNRETPKYNDQLKFSPTSPYEVRDYQQELIRKAHQVGSGIVRLATGGGKTLCIASIAAKYGIKTVIYVIGIELLEQQRRTFQNAFPHLKVGIVGDGNCDIQDITICTIWSAAAAFEQKIDLTDSDVTADSAKKNAKLDKETVKEMVHSAELFILDECQYAGAKTVQFLHNESVKARHRFLFSGTPWREAGDDLLIEAVGGPKFFDISASELIKRGWLVPPDIHFFDVPQKKKCSGTYPEVYEEYVVQNEVRNEKIVFATKKLVMAGKRPLILVAKIKHGDILREMLEEELLKEGFVGVSLDGMTKGSERLKSMQEVSDGKIHYLIASRIFDQGIDIPELDALILAGSGKSSGRALQRIGRVIRKFEGKKNAVVVDFMDNCKYLKNHSQARLKIYRSESEFNIKLP